MFKAFFYSQDQLITTRSHANYAILIAKVMTVLEDYVAGTNVSVFDSQCKQVMQITKRTDSN